MKNKFQIKIFKILIAVSLLPLFVISISNLYVTLKTRQQNINELQNLAIESASEKIKKFLNHKIENINLIIDTDKSDSDEIFTLIGANTLDFYIESIKAAAGDVDEISFISKNGIELIKKSDVLNSTISDVSAENYFIEVKKNKRYISPIIFKSGQPIIRISAQIENKNKEMIGAIAAVINLSPLKDTIDEIRLGETGYLYIIDSDGDMIYSARDKYKSGENLNSVPEIKNILSQSSLAGLAGSITVKNKDGIRLITAGKPVGMAGWYVVSEWPEKDAYGVIVNLIILSLAIAFFTLLFIIILSFAAAKKIVKPIGILSDGAKQISEGNLDYRINLKTNDEFEILGEKFNNMIEVLKENKKLKDEFVFIAAHELRTPVTAIKGYVSMMIDGSLGAVPKEIKDSLSIVFNSNERLVQLVHDLLEVARNDAGKMTINIKPVPVKESVKTVMAELKSLSEPKGIKLIYKQPADEIMVMADDIKLKEVLTNLIGNAIKYTLTNGDVEIYHEKDGKYLVTHIKDHGMGIAEENLANLFTKFYRVKTDKTEKIEGTGLGLFICKEIVERMNGKIWATSEVNKGSDFVFKLKIS